jgi:hypothetical protein
MIENEHWWNENWHRNIEARGERETLHIANIVHHKYHMELARIEPGALAVRCRGLTA